MKKASLQKKKTAKEYSLRIQCLVCPFANFTHSLHHSLKCQPVFNSEKFTMEGLGGRRDPMIYLGSHMQKSQVPIGCIARFLKADKYTERVGVGAPVYLAAEFWNWLEMQQGETRRLV